MSTPMTASPRPESLRVVSVPAMSLRTVPIRTASIFSKPRTLWSQHREASLNWLALGLLLAAWNAVGDDAASVRRRPDSLRAYPQVSLRAVQRSMSMR